MTKRWRICSAAASGVQVRQVLMGKSHLKAFESDWERALSMVSSWTTREGQVVLNLEAALLPSAAAVQQQKSDGSKWDEWQAVELWRKQVQ